MLQEFSCLTCNGIFHGMQINECFFHPDEPRFDKVIASSNQSNTTLEGIRFEGFFPCCSKQVNFFNVKESSKGCKA